MPERPVPHPAKAVIVGQGRTAKAVAAAIGVNAHTLGQVLNRRRRTWPNLRRRLAEELGHPESELFLEEDPDIVDRIRQTRVAQGRPPTLSLEQAGAISTVLARHHDAEAGDDAAA